VPLPDGWSDRTIATVVAPHAPGGYAPNAVITRELLCDGMGLGGFVEGQARLIREHAQEFSVLATEQSTLGGERALTRTVRWRIGDEPQVTQLSITCIRDGYAYAVVCSAPSESFAEAEPVFRALIEGFRFADDDGLGARP
jgi:hypothetical protein